MKDPATVFKREAEGADERAMELFVTIASVITAITCVTAAHTYLALAVADSAETLAGRER